VPTAPPTPTLVGKLISVDAMFVLYS